jgi:hypothetical protein
MYEILLTRVCALRLFFHFGFLVVSNCMLGIGASGSFVSVLQGTFAKRERIWLWRFSLLYLISLIAVYYYLVTRRIEPGINFQSAGQVINFALFNFVAAIPFFFAGCVIALILTFNAEKVNKIYCLDLLGAGLGCLLCPFFLWQTGAGGCFVFLTLLALAGLVTATPVSYRRHALVIGGIAAISGLLILPKFDAWLPVPDKGYIEMAEDNWIDIRGNVLFSRWSACSRVDLIRVAKEKRCIFGVGSNRLKDPLPEEKLMLQDGSAGSFALNFTEHPDALRSLKQSTFGIASILKKNARVFIIGVGGGNDVWGAKINGARYIKGVELNKQILDMHRDALYNFSRNIIDDPAIELVNEEGRSALMRDKSKYDVIQMSGIDTWTALTSGSYVLAENYLYTVEAIQNMYDHLTDEGIILITRPAKDMETLRLLSTIYAGLQGRSRNKFENSVACIYSPFSLMTTIVKKGEFSEIELKTLERICGEEGFDFVYNPQKKQGSYIDNFIRDVDKTRFIYEYPRDISPTTDNMPYFFNFTKWSQPFTAAKIIAEPPSISQGNPAFILFQLLYSAVMALVFIVLPLIIIPRKGNVRPYIKQFLIFFSGIGLGFIAIEIALIQKLVLFLGHPLYSITVTLFAMLIFTGIGSLLSERLVGSRAHRIWIVPIALSVCLGLFTLLSPKMVAAWIVWPQPARILITVLFLAPIGLLLGVPFAYGIRLVNSHNKPFVPWAWAVNGFMTVIGSILAVIVSMNFGFNAVLVMAILIYYGTFFAIRNIKTGDS